MNGSDQASNNTPVARLHGISRRYTLGKSEILALNQLDLDIPRGRLVVIAGPSGSGKSTLLHMLGALDRPDSGTVEVDGQALAKLDDNALSDFRSRRIGFVFQNFNLLPTLNALENVEYPIHRLGVAATQRRTRATDLLHAVGLGDKLRHRPGELSGGQRQRVAIARALANQPRIVIADEPTANLDRASAAGIVSLLRHLQQDTGATVVLSSHDPLVQAQADIRYDLVDGRIERVVGSTLNTQAFAEEIA
ncbi:MAG: ABC transporter ATP-binding protein [Rhodocyclaceae bacterium]